MGIFMFSVLEEDDPRATDDSGHSARTVVMVKV